MCNLLSANLYRLRKCKAFLLALAATLVYTVLVVIICFDHCAGGAGIYTLESILVFGFGLTGWLSVPALILAPTLAVYLGTERGENTFRNKLMIGHTRTKIYLSELLTCFLTALALDLLFLLLAGGLCAGPVLKTAGILLHVPPEQMAAWIGTALLARLASASVIKLTATVFSRKSNAAVAALLLAIGAMLVCRMGFKEIEFLENALSAGQPAVYGESRLVFWRLLVDTLPTGQYFQISRLDTPNLPYMPLLSLAVITASTGTGLAVFWKKDLR